jgi:hypothetical protein
MEDFLKSFRRAAWVASLICAGAPFRCEAARPLATEDADILDKSECEWEGVHTRQTARRSPVENGWETQLSCGVGLSTQVALAYGQAHASELTSRSVTLLGKTGLIERKDDGLGLTVAWTIGGVKEHNKAFKHDFTQLYLVATQEVVKDVTWHANLGWLRNQIDHRSLATWNLAGEYAVGDGVDLVGEFYGEARSKPWWGVGTRWQATEALSLNAGFGMQSEKPRIRQWSVGFKVAF